MSQVEALLSRPAWVLDKDVKTCGRCSKGFGATTRKHHCRVCGQVFCSKCCGVKLHIPSLGYKSPQRVCDGCRGQSPSVIGSKLQILNDVAKVRQGCDANLRLPPWDPRKAAYCGCMGVVEKQDPRDGSCMIKFSNGTYSWYPTNCLTTPGQVPQAAPTGMEWRMVVICPEKPHIEGAYSPTSKKNGRTVWSMGNCSIYSNTDSKWVLTTSEEGMQKQTGTIRTAEAHANRRGPNSMQKWEQYSSNKWKSFPLFSVYKAGVPGGSVPCINSSYRQPTIQQAQQVNTSFETEQDQVSQPRLISDDPEPPLTEKLSYEGSSSVNSPAAPLDSSAQCVPKLEEVSQPAVIQVAQAEPAHIDTIPLICDDAEAVLGGTIQNPRDDEIVEEEPENEHSHLLTTTDAVEVLDGEETAIEVAD